MDIRQAIIAASEGSGHSVFSASGSAGWAFCQDYLFANYGKADNGNEDAAYGTVGHSVGEKWLVAMAANPSLTVEQCAPEDLIGTTETVGRFEITIDREMLSYVREYVEWCLETPGDHYIETWVGYDDLMPIKGQGGTADYAACEPGRLTITDLKMGKGIQVYAEKNTQLLLYAYGFFVLYDWVYGFQEIVIRIAQPRRDHWDSWTITRAELLAFAEWIKGRAVLAWEGGPRSPGPKQCQWCKDVECAARLAALHADTEDVFDDLTVIEGKFSVVSAEQMSLAKEALDIGWEPDPKNPQTLSTLQLEKLLRLRKLIEKWMGEIESELESRALNGEDLELFKLVNGRVGNRDWESLDAAEELAAKNGISTLLLYKTVMLSPAQFEEVVRQELAISKKKAGELIAGAVIRRPGKQTLAPVSDRREEIQGPGDVFDDLTLEGL